jgi:hypothetical protein
MGDAPQKFHHKNKNFVVHGPMRHKKSYLCGAPTVVCHIFFEFQTKNGGHI